MKLLSIILISATIALSSCSSAYRTAQTPDDVYYSPGKGAAHATNNNDEYYNANPNDQYLMMKAQNPGRWSTFDDYGSDGFYSPYSSIGYGGGYYSAFSPWVTFGYWNPYYSYMNSYYMWNSFYNPYYYGSVVVVGGKYSSYNTYAGLHPFNANTYRNTYINNTNSRYYSPGNTRNASGNSFNNNNSTRRGFSGQGNNNSNFNNNRSFSQPTRTYSPSSSGGSGGGGGSRSGGGGFSRPGKG